MTPDDVVQDVDRAPLRVEHADDGIDGLLPDGQALLDEAGELLEQQAHLCHGGVIALGDDLVAAQRDARACALGDGPEQAVAVGAQLLRERVVDRECEGRGDTVVLPGHPGAWEEAASSEAGSYRRGGRARVPARACHQVLFDSIVFPLLTLANT